VSWRRILCLNKYHAMKTCLGSGGVAAGLLNLGITWKWIRKYRNLHMLGRKRTDISKFHTLNLLSRDNFVNWLAAVHMNRVWLLVRADIFLFATTVSRLTLGPTKPPTCGYWRFFLCGEMAESWSWWLASPLEQGLEYVDIYFHAPYTTEREISLVASRGFQTAAASLL